MTGLTDADLYRRGMRTLVASWEAYARGSRGAAVIRSAGVTAAVFPAGPERAFLNNALLEQGLAVPARSRALDAMQAAYASAGVTRFAAWVRETDQPMRGDLEARGYAVAEYTRAMGMPLSDIRVPRPEMGDTSASWPEYLRIVGLPAGFARQVNRSEFHPLTALHAHEAMARGCRTASLQSTAMAERIYETVGFRDLGRILEYLPNPTLPS